MRFIDRFCGAALSIALIAVGASAQTARTGGFLLPDTTVLIGGLTVSAWHTQHVTVTGIPDTMVFVYRPRNTSSLDSLATIERLRGAINGSFFDGARGDASHAGWLSLYGRTVTPLMDDRQLTHVVRISQRGTSVKFTPVKSFIHSPDPGVVEFQTGPLVIENGVIREDLIQGSINGPTRHRRTLLATLDHSKIFFVTVTDFVTLSELGAMLRQLSIFQKGRLDIVNLDGGSSVALYLHDAPAFNFNAEDTLPIVIGFH